MGRILIKLKFDISVSEKKMKYVYILLLKNGQLYTGVTKNLKRRFKEHQNKKVRFTSKRLPVRLIHYEVYLLDSDADRREKFLKTTEGKRLLRQQLRDVLRQFKVVI